MDEAAFYCRFPRGWCFSLSQHTPYAPMGLGVDISLYPCLRGIVFCVFLKLQKAAADGASYCVVVLYTFFLSYFNDLRAFTEQGGGKKPGR
jgi:hypothetical protein